MKNLDKIIAAFFGLFLIFCSLTVWNLLIGLTGASTELFLWFLYALALLIVLIILIALTLCILVGSAMCKRGYHRIRGHPLP